MSPPRFRSEPTAKRVRAFAQGRLVADSTRARIVWFGPVARTYAVPVEDVRGRVGPADGTAIDPKLGPIASASLEVDGARIAGAVLLPEGVPGLDGEVILHWNAMDAWFEEDEQVLVHPHDPFHRIDSRTSSREVVIEVGGVRIAHTRRPVVLFETGLPPRYYVPPLDVRLDLLKESTTRTACAYKGFATHYHAIVGGGRHEDVAWSYPATFLDGEPIRGLIAFYHERADVKVDDKRIG